MPMTGAASKGRIGVVLIRIGVVEAPLVQAITPQ